MAHKGLFRNYPEPWDAELEALIAAGAAAHANASSELLRTDIVDCCGKTIDKCKCTSTSSKEDKPIFAGSTYSLEEFAIAKHAMQLASTRNILSTLFKDFTYENVAVEFLRFVTFIRNHPEPGRSQLSTLIFPVTIHLYALLMQHEDIGVEGARKLINHNADILRLHRGYRRALAALSRFNDIEKLKQDSRFQLYIEHKTIIKISKDVFNSLQDFIKSSKNFLGEESILLSVLSFNIEFLDCDLYDCSDEDNDNTDAESKGKKKRIKKVKKIRIKKVKKIRIKKVKKIRIKKGKKKSSKKAKIRSILEGKTLSIIIGNQKSILKGYQKSILKGKEKSSKKGKKVSFLIGKKKSSKRGEHKKNKIKVRGKKKKKRVSSRLMKMKISEIVIYSKKVGENMTIYDFDTEETVVIEDIADYYNPQKKRKKVSSKPPLRTNPLRNVSNPFMDRRRKELELEAQPKPKKEFEVMPNPSLRSLYSVDFNCVASEISYATGDTFIYTLSTAAPVKKKKKTIKFIKDVKIILRTSEHNESGLKSTRDPEEENVFVVKYLPEDPFSLLAACSSKIRLFNTVTCSFLAEYVTDGSFIYDIDIDTTGQYFATANHYLASYIYTFGCNARICLLTGHEKAVTVVKFHPNGIYIATGSEDCTVRLFEVESGKCVRLFVGHIFGVWLMDFSYDGNLIACADSSGIVNVWNIKDCNLFARMSMRVESDMYSAISSLCFHERSLVLAVCSVKGEVQFWDVKHPEHKRIMRSLKKPLKIKRHKGKDWSLAYMAKVPKEPVEPKKR